MDFITNKKGFTLIELLIVITIIGILAVAFLPSLLGSPGKARDVQRVQALRKLSGVVTSNGLSLPLAHCWNGNSDVSQTVKNSYLPQMGGILPTDPVPTNNSSFNACGGIATCEGSYFSINCAPSNGVPRPLVFLAKVEDSSNGNNSNPCTCDPVLANSGPYYVFKVQR